jgi:hypothetical protein
MNKQMTVECNKIFITKLQLIVLTYQGQNYVKIRTFLDRIYKLRLITFKNKKRTAEVGTASCKK